jgi:hypothetical protein
VSWNLSMSAVETRSLLSAGASAAASSTSGMRAVKACDAMTSARSIPCRSRNDRRQRPGNVASSRRTNARSPSSVSVPLLPLRARIYTPVSAVIRPAAIAPSRAWWSRSFWSA